ENIQLSLIKILLIFDRCCFKHFIRVIKHDSDITNSSDTSFRTNGWLPIFNSWVTHRTFFSLIRLPVKVHFFIWTRGHTMSPGPAGVLIDENDSVFIRLYMAPEGQADTQGALIQCSQIRGKYIMNTSSNSVLIDSSIATTFGSCKPVIWPPARSSSQLGPHSKSMNSPVTADIARATG